MHTHARGSSSNVMEVMTLSWMDDKPMRWCCVLPSRSEIATVMATSITADSLLPMPKLDCNVGYDAAMKGASVVVVSPKSGKLRTKFVENEIISFVPVPIIGNNGVTEVHGIRKKLRDRKDSFNLGFGGTINILTEKNGRFLEIQILTRELGEVVQDGIDGHALSHRGLTIEDQIICKKEGVNWWTAGP